MSGSEKALLCHICFAFASQLTLFPQLAPKESSFGFLLNQRHQQEASSSSKHPSSARLESLLSPDEGEENGRGQDTDDSLVDRDDTEEEEEEQEEQDKEEEKRNVCDCRAREQRRKATTSLGPEFWRAKTANLLSATFRGNVVVVKRIGRRSAGVDLKNRENLKELNSVSGNRLW